MAYNQRQTRSLGAFSGCLDNGAPVPSNSDHAHRSGESPSSLLGPLFLLFVYAAVRQRAAARSCGSTP
eukprot:6721-Eustigmatos_ZCMA.PRE.1